MALTFVVYYRIHLNLNLEASARQWPNHNIPHSLVENPTLKLHTLLIFLSKTCSLHFVYTRWFHFAVLPVTLD